MKHSIAKSILATAVFALTVGAGPTSRAAGDDAGHGASWPAWRAAWSASPHAASALSFGFVNWSLDGFSNHSVRQVVRAGTGGALLRIRLSNRYGVTPVRLAGATIARTAEGASVRPGSIRPLSFGLSHAAAIPAGGELVSDPTFLPTAPFEHLTVTLYFAEPTGPATYHWFANATTYRAAGDHRHDRGGQAFQETSPCWYFLEAVEVARIVHRPGADTVVAFGDSITDGAFSTSNADRRYPDLLAGRLAAAGRRLTVLNAGIAGNLVLTDSACFGEKATARFLRDALEKPGVRSVIVLEGTNDIGSSVEGTDFGECLPPMPKLTAERLIAGHREMIQAAHARGIRIIGATILPFKGAGYYSESGEAIRSEVNDWIRNGGEYDAVVDFDRALRDPADPKKLRAEYDGGDALHPNDAGMRALADAVDLDAL